MGVDWRDGSDNFDKGITDHWVIINGRGSDNNGTFYTYFEVAQKMDFGVSKDRNKFYLTANGYLEALYKTVNTNGLKPVVTAIRYEPNNCACDRNNYDKEHNPKCGEFYNHITEPNGTLIKIR